MRTLLATLALATTTAPALAHEGHGDGALHWHGGDLLAALATAAVVMLWLWQRGRR